MGEIKLIKLITRSLVLVMFSGAYSLAFSQSGPFKEGFYLGAEIGSVALANQTGAVASALVNAVGGSASASQDPNLGIGRILGGYKLNENVGFELGASQSSTANLNFVGVSRSSVAYTGNVNFKVSGFDYSVLVRPSISSGLNGLYGKFGGHSLSQSFSTTLTSGFGTAASVNSFSGTGYLFGAGYDASIGGGFDARISYTRLNSIAGQSGVNANLFGIGLVKSF